MKTFLLWSVSIAFLVFTSLRPTYSQTIVPGGYVSGTWPVSGSPYLVQGNITIHADSTLTIQPGVDVIFQGYYRFYISGVLEAIGTETDSISFTPSDTSTGWRGLYFGVMGTRNLSYCNIKYSQESGIRIDAVLANIIVSHCNIVNNRALNGGGIYMSELFSQLTISNSNISYNTAESDTGGWGGGVFVQYGTMNMDNCTVLNNRAVITNVDYVYTVKGGGICIAEDAIDVTINNSTINKNFIGLSNGGPSNGWMEGGGGIYNTSSTSVTISNCNISENINKSGEGRGGGIFIKDMWSGSTTISHCIISKNYSTGAGLYSLANTDVINCTFYKNKYLAMLLSSRNNPALINVVNNIVVQDPYSIEIGSGTLLSVNIKYNNILGNCTGSMPPGFGVLDTLNFNGDSCDVYFNIFKDPLFADTANGDFHLTWDNWPTPDSTKSPCIDAGDPTSPFDPDGTITDLGVFSFDQSVPVELVSFTAELIENNVVLKWITATETNNSGFEIQRKLDKEDWEKIGFVEGHGTTTEIQEYSYRNDISDINEKSVTYRLKQIDFDGSYEYSKEVLVENVTPLDFALYQNYPNPFNPLTTIKYNLPLKSQVALIIYNSLGEKIRQLVNEEIEPGYHHIEFNASNLPSGVYFYKLQAGDFIQTKKMILLK